MQDEHRVYIGETNIVMKAFGNYVIVDTVTQYQSPRIGYSIFLCFYLDVNIMNCNFEN